MLPKAIDRYIISAVLPYIVLALVILSLIILIQQTSKFSEILGYSGAPLRLAAEVSFYLLPGLLIFTLPTATLVGVATGFSRLGHDSELVAMRAAGVGTFRIIAPSLVLGVLLSLLTLYVGFKVSPASSQALRELGLRAASYKLESPVEPKSFYTGMPGKVIYVREGDKEQGQWRKIFIYWQESDGKVRLVTAGAGRLDFSGDQTELVLEDALMTTLFLGDSSATDEGENVTVERSASMRIRDERLNSGRNAIAKRIREREPELDELGWAQLLKRAETSETPSARREAVIMLNKKLSLCLSPIVFSFLGAILSLRVVRGGRAQGVIYALGAMLFYYLIFLGGEQLGRVGVIPAFAGPWIAFALSVSCGLFLFATRSKRLSNPFGKRGKAVELFKKVGITRSSKGGTYPWGLLDRHIFKSFSWNFLLTFSSIVAIFLIFTLFEILRFIARNNVRTSVVVQYLIYLIPFTGISVAPVCTLLSVLITFALLNRRSETVAWLASGQSVFRLILPCAFLALFVGAGVWFTQEGIMPFTDRRQNLLRGVIRSGSSQLEATAGRIWVSSQDSKRIYSYEPSAGGVMNQVLIFDFTNDLTHIERFLISSEGRLTPSAVLEMRGVELISLGGAGIHNSRVLEMSMQAEDLPALDVGFKKPSEFDYKALSAYIRTLKEKGMNAGPVAVALERRKVEPFYPLVMVLFAAPLAFVFGRKGTMWALCLAVGVGLLFLGITNGLQQLGSNGYLSPVIASWSPLILFLAAGVYLLSRSRT